MDVSDLVTRHYAGVGLTEIILAAFAERGFDTDALTVDDLALVDQLHAGFAPATVHLLETLAPPRESTLLDVGCGIGGTARIAAARFGLRVTGVDLTPEFVEAAGQLTAKVGLADRVTFRAAPGAALPLDEASCDNATMVHVGMNVPDKAAVFRDVHRVLVPGGRFGLFEQVRGAAGDLPYPMPWADDERSSFVETPAQYVEALETAGFVVESVEDRTADIAGRPDGAGPDSGPPPLTPGAVLGPGFRQRIDNNVAATTAGLLCAVQVVARRP
jgi:SAM-dependent methyltransferase